MPSKKKKKKRKKQEPQLIEFTLNFSDPTISESEGKYNRVNELLQKSQQQTAWTSRYRPHFSKVVESLGDHDWVVKSNLTVESPFGIGVFELDFHKNGHIYILDYRPSTSNTSDLSTLLRWSQEAGWNFPQPHPAIVRANLVFWRQVWETTLVDSDYLTERYGLRTSERANPPKTEMEVAEDEEIEFDALDEVTKANRREDWKKQIGIVPPSKDKIKDKIKEEEL